VPAVRHRLLLVAAGASAHAYDLVPMWESRANSSRDSFYTQNQAEHLYSVQIGFQEYGAAFWLPCAQNVAGPDGQTGSVFANLGFTDDVPMCARPAGAAPLYRFYKGSPATDHFYTTSKADADLVQTMGYVYEGVEGYVFSAPGPGRVPL